MSFKMSDEASECSEVYNLYLKLSKPTEEDFKRVFTEDELKELCLRHKCRVDMYRWNVVNDYRILFTESGRFQRWSERDRLRMLAKAVNKMKPSVLYDEEEIKKEREEYWGLQLKENILSLNFWKRQRLQLLSESDDVDQELQSQYEVNTESMNAAELLTQSESQRSQVGTVYREIDEEIQLQVEVNTESRNAAGLNTQNHTIELPATKAPNNREIENRQIQQCSQIQHNAGLTNTEEPKVQSKLFTNGDITTPISTETEEGNILLADFGADYLLDDDSEDSVETVLLNKEHQLKVVVETLHSEEIAPEIENIYGVNTMSMTIGSQISTQSQNMPTSRSQDVISPNYDNFINIIPLTSTQSQNQESEEIIIS